MTNEERCAVHRHKTRVPIDRHHIWPLGMGGPDTPENIVTVCPNGHRDIHDYMRELIRTPSGVSWLIRIGYGWKVRRLARRGLKLAREATSGNAS